MDGVRRYLDQVRQTLTRVPEESVNGAIDVLLCANRLGNTVFTMGNGGSAATASHFACDLAKGTITIDQPRFRVRALTDSLSLMTAWSNDVAYEAVFAEQLRGWLQPGDVVVAFSGSGNSLNVLHGVELANELGAITIGFTGFDGGELSKLVDLSVWVPCDCMEQVEDVHMTLCHLMASVVRARLEQGAALACPPLDVVGEGHLPELVSSARE